MESGGESLSSRTSPPSSEPVSLKLAERANVAQPSVTLALNARAQAMSAAGKDVVSLAAGEPDFDTPAHIGEAAIAAIRSGFTRYTSSRGTPELRKAIVEKLKKDNGLDYRTEQILVSCGAKHSLYNAFQALLEPGDEAVIFAPYWVSYPDMVRIAGAKPVIVECRESDGYEPTAVALRRALTPRTRVVIFNSPCNPSGAVWRRETLAALGRELEGHSCAIVTDDIYEKLVYDGTFSSVVQECPSLKDRTLVINGVSKTYAMTGWRIGYAAGPADVIDAMGRLQDQSTSCPTSISQKAAFAALTGPTAPIAAMVAEFDRRRRSFAAGLRSIPGVSCANPAGAFYALPNIHPWLGKSYRGQTIKGSVQVAEILLTDFGLAVVPGEPFGAEGHLRLSFAASDESLNKGLSRLAAFQQALT